MLRIQSLQNKPLIFIITAAIIFCCYTVFFKLRRQIGKRETGCHMVFTSLPSQVDRVDGAVLSNGRRMQKVLLLPQHPHGLIPAV